MCFRRITKGWENNGLNFSSMLKLSHYLIETYKSSCQNLLTLSLSSFSERIERARARGAKFIYLFSSQIFPPIGSSWSLTVHWYIFDTISLYNTMWHIYLFLYSDFNKQTILTSIFECRTVYEILDREF